LHERVLAIYEKAFGPEHPNVAIALHNLAILLRAQGSYAEARSFYERGLSTTLQHLSKNLGDMTEAERFRYLNIQTSPEPLLLNLAALQGEGPFSE
jgi:tetratricopeptide (TPR) repeat protein